MNFSGVGDGDFGAKEPTLISDRGSDLTAREGTAESGTAEFSDAAAEEAKKLSVGPLIFWDCAVRVVEDSTLNPAVNRKAFPRKDEDEHLATDFDTGSFNSGEDVTVIGWLAEALVDAVGRVRSICGIDFLCAERGITSFP